MKRILLLIGIAMSFAQGVLAQEAINKLSEKSERYLDENYPVTDTLVFSFPNEGKLALYFNHKYYDTDSITAVFQPLLEKATRFPEFQTLAYRLDENFPATQLDQVKFEIEKKYVPHLEMLGLTFPVGLDFTGGNFTPVVGFRAMVHVRNKAFGASITNTIHFPTPVENKLQVNSNWFVNAEFSWELRNIDSSKRNTIGVGYLLNDSSPVLFPGHTIQAYYNRKISDNISLQVGVIGTDNLKTFYPTVGIRFW
ncbi:hypothetical protein J0A68_10440 [Algoriphagus sp. H41]|uniref:Transporter n=1 Tax=Algoriphagus oliviformis TaxID=2811231 RepID=A0ABS3C2N6_9BACT|nr:hypothetical protein [Algoriphagus oliviformis]MBN7811377.1 hypothetical protein [Algoriphagus oliviformis]